MESLNKEIAAEFDVTENYLSRLTWKEIIQQMGYAPNMLSVSRIVFLPFVIFLVKHDIHPWAFIALGMLWVTDFIDGYIARRFRQETDLGLLLDPIADKLTSSSLFLALYFYRDFPLWIVVIMVSKDALIVGGGYFMLRRRKIYSSNQLGRITTVLVSVIILLYVLRLEKYSIALCYILMALIAATLVSYGSNFMQFWKEFKWKRQ